MFISSLIFTQYFSVHVLESLDSTYIYIYNYTVCACVFIYLVGILCQWRFSVVIFFSNNRITKMTGNTFSAPGGSLSHSEVITERLKTYFASHLWLAFIELG